jgi:hypothetical protein
MHRQHKIQNDASAEPSMTDRSGKQWTNNARKHDRKPAPNYAGNEQQGQTTPTFNSQSCYPLQPEPGTETWPSPVIGFPLKPFCNGTASQDVCNHYLPWTASASSTLLSIKPSASCNHPASKFTHPQPSTTTNHHQVVAQNRTTSGPLSCPADAVTLSIWKRGP